MENSLGFSGQTAVLIAKRERYRIKRLLRSEARFLRKTMSFFVRDRTKVTTNTAIFYDVVDTTTSVSFQPGSYGVMAGATLYVAVSSTGAGGAESPVSTPASKVVQ